MFELPVIFLAAVVAILYSAIKILREYERGVIFLLGRFWKVKGPGLIIVIPGIQKMIRVDLRTVVMDVPPQDVISRDNVSVTSASWTPRKRSFRWRIASRQPANSRRPRCAR